GEEPPDIGGAAHEAGWGAGGEEGVELARFEHAGQRLVGRDSLEVEAGNGGERRALAAAGLLLAALAPFDVGRLDAVLVLHDAALPDHGGDLIFRHADALALEVLRLGDAAIGADIDAGMAED